MTAFPPPPPVVAFLSGSRTIGGAERSLMDLVSGLRAQGLRCLIVGPGDSPLRDRAEEEGIVYEPFAFRSLKRRNVPATLLYLLAFRRLVARLVEKHGVEVLYSNTFEAYTTLAFAPKRIPRIAHHRDVRASRLCVALYPRVDLNIFISRFNFANSGAPENSTVIMNGIRFAEPSPSLAAARPLPASGLPDDAPLTMAMFARVARLKGHWLVLEASRLLRERGIDHRIDIWGIPFDRAERALHDKLTQIVSRHDLPVVFKGFTPDPVGRMAEYDLLLNPSLDEPFGRVPVEGFDIGRPVLSHASGGSLEIYTPERSGMFLFDTWDGAALADRIAAIREAMAAGEAFADCVSEMQDHVRAAFSVDRLAREVHGAITSVLDGRTGGRMRPPQETQPGGAHSPREP